MPNKIPRAQIRATRKNKEYQDSRNVVIISKGDKMKVNAPIKR